MKLAEPLQCKTACSKSFHTMSNTLSKVYVAGVVVGWGVKIRKVRQLIALNRFYYYGDVFCLSDGI